MKDFREMKKRGEKITALTAYDYPTARLLDETGIDIILVGDSLGMVVLGYEDTTRVKLEGGVSHVPQIEAITGAGIPFLAHIGMLPQSVHEEGGYKVKGRTQTEAEALIADAHAVEKAGAFAVVLEIVAQETAKQITNAIGIPTIGIGSGEHCDGQILVTHDLIGLFPWFTPKFVSPEARVAEEIRRAATSFIEQTRNGNALSNRFAAGRRD